MTATHRSIARRPAGVIALVAAALTVLALMLASQASAAPTTLNVNASTGNDTNPGTAAQPLKTLGRGLKLAHSGDTVKLAAGAYGPGFSGDQFPAAGLVVPAGVTIDGGGPDGSLGATLLGPGSGVGLSLAGSATVRNLVWGGQGFGVGLFANQGTQSLSNLFIGMGRDARGPVGGGAMLNGGVFLRGTAQATLTKSTIFLLFGGATGVSVNEQARFTMDGGSITGGDQPNCERETFGIELNQSAQATVRNVNAPGFQNIAGSSLRMGDNSKATLSDSVIDRALTSGCASRPSVTLDQAAALTVQRSNLMHTIGGGPLTPATAIAMGSSGPLALHGSLISRYATGIDMRGTGSLTANGTSFSQCKVCLDAQFAAGLVTITNSSFRASAADGVGLIARSPKVRGTEFAGNAKGVVITGTGADLGTASSPGNNDFRNNRTTAVQADDKAITGVINAVGNQWEPNKQAADASGHYITLAVVNGLSSLAQGTNFDVQQFAPKVSTKIRLASPPIGRLRLTPHTLRARVGKAARLRLSWTHPESWRELRKVELRIHRGARAVGTITARPRNSRLSARGAIRLVAGRSRLTHRGKTVTARLAVRLSRSLAGTRLRVSVRATDRRGHRQLEPFAGRIEVAR